MPLKPSGNIRQLFSPRWEAMVGGVQALGHMAEVKLVSYSRTGTIDPDTGKIPAVEKVHFDNLTARIQPLHTPSYMEDSTVDTIVKRVRVQMDKITDRIDLGWELIVTECDSNPTLTTFQYTNMEVVNSSNNVDTTLLFQVNPRVKNGS